MWGWIWVIIVVIAIIIVVRWINGRKSEDSSLLGNAISRVKSIGNCCKKGFSRLFGGGA